MKKTVITILIILTCMPLIAQPPQTFNYQAVLRDASGKIRANENIDIEVSIIQGTADGTPEYTESHSTETNAHGLVNLRIGEGVTTDDFSTIEWSNGPFFISINVNGLNIGTSQLLSVPYALHAETAQHMENPPEENDPVFTSSIAAGITANDTASWNNKQEKLIAGSGVVISNNMISSTNVTNNIPIKSTTEIIALSPSNGEVLFNSTESLYQIYDGSDWQSIPAACWPQPTDADAGSDQTFSDATTSTTLSANLPEIGHGRGLWTVISGENASFDDISSPTSIFNGTLREKYLLIWNISTRCNNSSDTLIIGFYYDIEGPSLTDFDGNNYNTVWIGDQLWMAENLRTTKYSDGTPIKKVEVNSDWDDLEENDIAYCWYNNDSVTNASNYGALYTWTAAMNGNSNNNNNPSGIQGVCPSGWHLPSESEWRELIEYLGGTSLAGGKLKETGSSHWNEPNSGANNKSKFNALPGGAISWEFNGSFSGLGTYGNWWTTTKEGNAIVFTLRYNNGNASIASSGIANGMSVRCIKDKF